jgi:hypothetical protein
MPKYRIKSDILGVDFGIQTDQKLTERDYFDILKTKVSPQKMLRAYKNNKDDEKVQALATKALDNNYFEGADFGTAFSEGAKSFGRGVKNMFVTNIYGTSRLLDATMQYGEADESQKYDELVEEGIKKAGQQLKGLSYASKRTDRTIEDDLSQALQFAGLSQDDENLKKRVIAEARRQDNFQAEATRAQMGVDATGMMAMLGAKLFQGLGDAKDIATGEVSFGGDSKKRKLRQLDYLIEQDYIGRTIERGAELGLQLGGALSTISQVYTGMDLSPFEKNEEALRDVKSGLVKPDRDVAMLGSMFADPGMGATVLASGGLAFGRNFIARGAIIKTGQKAAQESALKSTIAQLSDIANPTNTQKALLKTAEKNLAKVTGSGEKLEKLVAKAEGIAQAEAGKLLQKGQGNTPMAARLFQAIDKAPPPKAPFSNRMTGKILEKAGVSAEYLGRTIEFLQRLPEETLGTLFMRSGMDEQAAMTAARATARTLQGTAAAGVVTGGFNEFTPELENLGLALLLAPGGSSLVTRFGHDAAILGKQLQYAQTSSPLFQRIAQLDPADSSLTAVTLDRTSALTIPGTISGLAEGIFAKSRQFGPSPALKAPATALTRTGLGNTLTGAVNATKTAIGASAIPGAIGYAVDGEAGAGGAITASIPFIAAGLGFGTLARYGSQADVRAKMLGDQAYYKDTYLTDTEVGMYDSLAKPVRQAIATSVIQNPDVVYRFQNDRGNSHWSVENGESVVTIFTKSAPQEQLSAVLGHEIAHHIDAFGFMPQIIEQLVGSVEKNQPGLFTEYKNGKPVIIKDAEGRDVYATNKEFAKHRQRYLDLLEQSGIDKNSPDYQAYANDDSRIAREIFASHGAAWYFGGDFVTRNYQGAGAKMMGAILDPLFSSPGLRKFFHRIGLATQETTRLVADPLRLFPELKEVPALTRMIEKYNDDVRGFGPQARREGRGRGNLVDPEFADEIATASLTAKDLENPAIVNRLKAGGVVKIKDDGSIETDASGKPVFLPSREVNKKNKQLSQDILQIIRKKEDAGETFGEGHVSMEKTADGKERAAGRFLDPSIIDELAKTGKYNPHQLAALKQISQTLRNNTGDVWNLFYYSALKWNKAGRKVYGQIKGGDRKSLPFGIEITKDGNINIQTISVDAFKKNLEWFAKSKGYEKKMSEAFGGMNAWENAQNAYKLLPKYLQNHMNGIINGEKGSGITPLQRDLINAAIGRVNADQVKANPILEGLGDRRSQRQQSIRSRRLDRIGNAIRGESGFPAFKSAIEQNKVPMFMPGRGEGDKLFMPASEAGAGKGKVPKTGDMLTLDDKSLKLFLPSPSNPNASLSDFKGKNVQVLTTDLSMVGDKKIDGATVAFTGGPGYLSVNDAWGFTNEGSAKAFKTRWKRDDKPLIGLTSMKQDNHKASTLTREYYVRKFMQAINQGKITESLVNEHIIEALTRAAKGKGLTDSQKRALLSVKNIKDFLRIFSNGQIIPWKATPKIYDRLSQATLPIKQGKLKELGLDLDTILRETRQKEYNDIKKGSLLAIAEYDGSDAVYRPDLNSAYPWSIPLKEKAFLKDFADIQDLSSRQDLRGSDGDANMAVAMGAGVMLDKLGRGDVNFMPSGRPTRQPANRITRQAPAMPGNRFMLPAVSAGAKSAERFR